MPTCLTIHPSCPQDPDQRGPAGGGEQQRGPYDGPRGPGPRTGWAVGRRRRCPVPPSAPSATSALLVHLQPGAAQRHACAARRSSRRRRRRSRASARPARPRRPDARSARPPHGAPVVEPRRRHAGRFARLRHREPGRLLVVDTLVAAHGVDDSFTQKASDRLSRSRSIRSCAFSARSSASSARSSAVSPIAAALARALRDPVPQRAFVHADRTGHVRDRSFLIEHHRHRVPRNSGGYFDGRPLGLFLLDMDFLLYEVSAQRGDAQPTIGQHYAAGMYNLPFVSCPVAPGHSARQRLLERLAHPGLRRKPRRRPSAHPAVPHDRARHRQRGPASSCPGDEPSRFDGATGVARRRGRADSVWPRH